MDTVLRGVTEDSLKNPSGIALRTDCKDTTETKSISYYPSNLGKKRKKKVVARQGSSYRGGKGFPQLSYGPCLDLNIKLTLAD